MAPHESPLPLPPTPTHIFPPCLPRTAATEDGLRSAQFEHQLLITPQGCEVLTARLPTSPPLWWEVEDASLAAKTGQVLSV